VRRLGAGAGLIAALKPEAEEPVWVLTGVDDAGVARAVSAFKAATLRNAYALAVTPSGNVKLPAEGGSG
jgi:hypothetical protein